MFRKRLTWAVAALGIVAAGLSVFAQGVGQSPGAAPPSEEFYAANLGVYYRLEPLTFGGFTSPQGNYNPNSPPGYAVTYGARLTRYPVPGSPCAYLQFEPGDMIVSLDNLPFQGPNDVTAHFGATSMVFINVRTNQPQAANLMLPMPQ
jgi:hypothetical protein